MAASSEEQDTEAVDVGSLLDAGSGTLVTLVAGDIQLEAHRAVLSAGSPVFAAMFGHDMLEASSGQVKIRDVEGPVLRQMLSYLYTQRALQLPAVAGQLLVAADKYGVAGLKAQCEHHLASKLQVQTAAETAVLAVRHSCPFLTEATADFIATNPQVLSTQAWAEVARDHPGEVAELSRLLAEAKPPTTGRKIPIFIPPPDPAAVTRMRRLPEEERCKRMFVVAQMGAVEELKVLIVAGADIEAKDEDFNGMTALQWAAARGQAEAVRCLVEAGAQVGALDDMRCTALHHAAYRGRAAAARLLLAASADPNARNQWERTPLHDAAEKGHPEVVTALLEAGGDRRARTDRWRTPLDLATSNNQQQVIAILS